MPRSTPSRRSTGLMLEALEGRVLLSTLTVINNADTGAGSLRQAILDANANPGSDTINFNLPANFATISPASPLPEITDALTLDGTTQPGYSGTPLVHIDGYSSPDADILVISAGNSTVRGLDIHNYSAGTGSALVLKTHGNNTITGNYLGVQAYLHFPEVPQTYYAQDGLGLSVQSDHNLIGGESADAGNIIGSFSIAGNDNIVQANSIGVDPSGIRAIEHSTFSVSGDGNTIGGETQNLTNIIANDFYLSGSNNTVEGNLIGTDYQRALNLGGRFILGGDPATPATGNIIGGTGLYAGNTFANGLRIGSNDSDHPLAAHGNIVQNNDIGTSLYGNALHNPGNGIDLFDSGNTIGGTDDNSDPLLNFVRTANRIAGNAGHGIYVTAPNDIFGNWIGRSPNGSFATNGGDGIHIAGAGSDVGGHGPGEANLIINSLGAGIFVEPEVTAPLSLAFNSIYDNVTVAIDLPAPINAPIVSQATLLTTNHSNTGLVVQGLYHGAPNATFTLHFYANYELNPTGHAEAATYLGAITVTTDANGDTPFSTTITHALPAWSYISALAVDGAGQSSEVSPARRLIDPAAGVDFVITTPEDQYPSTIDIFEAGQVVPDHQFEAYPGSIHGARVAQADVNGDGVNDIITAAGVGEAPHVKVFDAITHEQLAGPIGSFYAYDAGLRTGISIAAADVDGDGYADIITGAGTGAGPHVKVFSGATGEELKSFYAYDPGFLGGVRVAAADFDGDGKADIATAAASTAPHVKIFSAADNTELQSFFAYDNYGSGAFIAAADLNDDGTPDLVTASDSGTSHVKVFSGGSPEAPLLASFIAYPNFSNGARVSTVDWNHDDLPDLLISPGPGHPQPLRVYDPRTGLFLDQFDPYADIFAGGIVTA